MSLNSDQRLEVALYIGASFAMAYWLVIVTIFMVGFCWDHRSWLLRFWRLDDKELADLVLNWSMMGFMGYACAQRAGATYYTLVGEWSLAKAGLGAPFMPEALFSLAGIIWWACFHRHRPNHKFWWSVWVGSGAVMSASLIVLLL